MLGTICYFGKVLETENEVWGLSCLTLGKEMS